MTGIKVGPIAIEIVDGAFAALAAFAWLCERIAVRLRR